MSRNTLIKVSTTQCSGQEPILGEMNYLKRSDGTRMTRATMETQPNVKKNLIIQVL